MVFLAILAGTHVARANDSKVFKIDAICKVKDAYAIKQHKLGIKGNASGGRAEVRMYKKSQYSSGGRNDASLLYGAFTDRNDTDEFRPQGWITGSFWYCLQVGNVYINPFCNSNYGDVESHESYLYKRNISEAAKHYALSGIGLTWYSYEDKKINVTIELEISGSTALTDITEIKVPGVGTLKPSDFVTYVGDFSALFNPDNEVTAVAHRGYWEERGVVQNSLAAIDAANAISGLDWIELDIRSTKDMHPILFHDDKPQKILQDVKLEFPAHPDTSVYDFHWADLQNFFLYDRFNLRSGETLVDLNTAFSHIKTHNITKPVNMDIGIPGEVPQGWDYVNNKKRKVSGQPFFDAVFLQAIDLACHYGLTNQIVFKGKYKPDDSIWSKVDSVLIKYATVAHTPNRGSVPKIAYTPKLGDDTPDSLTYFNGWTAVKNGTTHIPGVEMVGMEIRLKNDDSGLSSFLNDAITEAHANDIKVGVFSEAPSTCQGYWTKSAVEKYINFEEDKRNSFEWLLGKKYDYIITDFPKNLIELRAKRVQYGVHN